MYETLSVPLCVCVFVAPHGNIRVTLLWLFSRVHCRNATDHGPSAVIFLLTFSFGFVSNEKVDSIFFPFYFFLFFNFALSKKTRQKYQVSSRLRWNNNPLLIKTFAYCPRVWNRNLPEIDRQILFVFLVFDWPLQSAFCLETFFSSWINA